MACAYFDDRRICQCRAVRGLLTPSVHERERFCRSDDPGRCPTLRLRRSRDEALPQEVYYALWLPLAGADEPGLEVTGSVP